MKKLLPILFLLITLTSFVGSFSPESKTGWNVCSYTIENTELQTYHNKLMAKGDTLSDYKLACYDTLITNLKAKNVWQKLDELATFDGSFNSAFIKLKFEVIDSLINHGFVAGDWNVNTGFTGNGTSKWIDPGFDMHNVLKWNLCWGFWSADDNNKGAAGGGDTLASTYGCFHTQVGQMSTSSVSPGVPEAGTRIGLYTLVSDWTGVNLYINDVLRSSKSLASSGNVGGDLNLFRYNNTNYFDGKISLYFRSDILTNIDVKNLSDEINRFYENIGRVERDKIVFLGDSYTYGTGASPKNKRWTTILADSLDLFEINCGTIGRLLQYNTTIGASGRSNFYNQVLPHKPKELVIALGINDVFHNAASITNYDTQLRYVIDYFIKSGIDTSNIWVLTPYHVKTSAYSQSAPFNGGSYTEHIEYCDTIKAICQDFNVHCIDARQIIVDNGGDTHIATDGVHFKNNAAHQLFAEELYDLMK